MSLAFGFALPHWQAISGGAFSPASLFAGVNGVFYDISDLSTLFTTSAGTTQCAMPGQGSAVSVGAMLDKRATGYSLFFDGTGDYLTAPDSADLRMGTGDFTVEFWIYFSSISGFQSPFDKGVTGSGALLIQTGNGNGRMIVYAGGSAVITETGTGSTGTWIHYAVVRNAGTLKIYRNGTETGSVANTTDFNNTSALGIGAYAGASGPPGATSVNGYLSNVRVVKGTAVYTGNFTPPTAPLSPITGTSLLTCGTTWSGNPAITTVGNTRVDGLNPFTASPAGNHAIAFNDTTARPELRARVNLLVATATLSTQSVTTQATSYTLRFAGTGDITLSGTATGSYSAGTHTITCTAGTLTLTVSGTVTTADLRPANSGALLPAYQAVVDANTYDTSGFPLYLLFDGIDDSMYTPANLNLSGTDKVAVFAGVRKLSDTSSNVGNIAELSAAIGSNNGAFELYAPTFSSVANSAGFASKGTTTVEALTTAFNTPSTAILTGLGDISGDRATLRLNGTQVAQSTNDQGTGNYGTYPLYIGARNNASFFFNGHLHSLIIAGSAVSAGNISATEQWVAQRTGIVIP